MEKKYIIPKLYSVCNRCVHAKDALGAAKKTLGSLPPNTHTVEIRVECMMVGRTMYADMAVGFEVSPPKNRPNGSDFSIPHQLCPGYVARARETNPNAYPKSDISGLLEENPFSPKEILGF